MKIVVTGADGFVGGYLIPRLYEYRHELFLIGRDLSCLNKNCSNHSLCLSYIDLSQSILTQKITEFSPDAVIHLAAYSSSADSYEEMEKLFSANIVFLGKTLEALKNSNLKCFVYTGSSTEFYNNDAFFNPAYLYSATKTAGRSILNYYSDVYDFKTIVVTPYTVYGGINTQKKIIDILYDSLGSVYPVNTTAGEQILDFIHVIDLVELYCKIIENIEIIPDGTDFHAGTGKGNSIRKLAKLLEKNSNKTANIIWGGIPYRKKDLMYAVANIKNQQKILNWQPGINLNKGVKMYLDARDRLKN